MTAISIVARRCVTVRGPTDTIYFCANVYSEVTTQTLLGSSAFSSRLRGSRLNFSDSLAFLAFHPSDSSRIHLDNSFSAGYYSAGSEARTSRHGADTDSRATHRRMPEGPSELGGWSDLQVPAQLGLAVAD